MHHLDVVTGTHLTNPVAAGGVVFNLGADGLEDVLDERPGSGRAARHHARAAPCAFFATGDPGADVQQPLRFDVFLAAVGVFEQRVAAVDDDVALVEMRDQLLDEVIHRLAGLDQHHHAPWRLEFGDHFFNRMRAKHLGALGFVGEEVINLVGGTVVDDDGKTVVIHVQNQILAHDGKANQCDVSFLFHGHLFL